MIIQLSSSTTHGLNQFAILLLITINLLPVTMCYSLRPIWINPSSSSSSSYLSSSSSSSSLSSTPSDYIDTQRLFDSINDLNLPLDSEIDSTDDNELNSFTNNNLIKLNDLESNSNHQIKSSPVTISNVNDNQPILIQPWIESEILSTSINGNVGGTRGRRILFDPKMTIRGGGGGRGEGGIGNGNRSDKMEDKKRSDSRVKKALSLFAHWKPATYKQHLDDAYSSELVSAVSRGHGRTMGHSLRWG
ncbi:uncharacterized protein LOC128386752 [Panonychus citri]|uniref:uncharacterized protein LOC128386752 n=1 Tax=Panonychus citri TaxID=50023 RepID=UPI002307EE9F|nr:uncharacterized protein LOC128386752 [Panonychus citri]